MELTLVRTYYPTGTNGQLYLGSEILCATIELPWKNNQRQVSCIPEGKYELKKRFTPQFGDHLYVRNVPGRTNILIHAFNHAIDESKGCIAPVSRHTGEGAGIFSRLTLKKLTALVYPELKKGNKVFLTIQRRD
jgi:hypothetical protein